MPVQFSSGQTLALLAKLHHVPLERHTAFGSRIKHLQKLGMPTGARPGRGRAGSYSLSQVMQLAFALDLQELGVSPAIAAQTIGIHWTRIVHRAWIALSRRISTKPKSEESEREFQDQVVVLFSAAIEETGFWFALTMSPTELPQLFLEETPGGLGDRMIILQPPRLARRIYETIIEDLGFFSADQMEETIRAEAAAFVQSIERVREKAAPIREMREKGEEPSSEAMQDLWRRWMDDPAVKSTLNMLVKARKEADGNR